MTRSIGCISAIFLSVLLLLLTVGLPVTYSAVARMKACTSQHESTDKNPYSNTTEEKTPSNNLSISEEYVHDARHDLNPPGSPITMAYRHAHEATYIAYHGELHCPPPNI